MRCILVPIVGRTGKLNDDVNCDAYEKHGTRLVEAETSLDHLQDLFSHGALCGAEIFNNQVKEIEFASIYVFYYIRLSNLSEIAHGG